TRAKTVRLDRVAPDSPLDDCVVKSDARQLPFACHTFAAVIANHSLEHIDDLGGSLIEIGRVLRRDGCLFASVPDASTFTDKLYRWLSRGGGHVNPFSSSCDLAKAIERCTGLRLVGARTPLSFLAFFNAPN